MILRFCTSTLALAACALCALPAQADVLEISPQGEAQWIAGPLGRVAMNAVQPASPLAEVPAEVLVVVPEGAVADTRAHSAAVPQAYAAYIQELANRFDLSPALLEALVWQESRWRENAVSPAGARGLAQLMPGTARDLGVGVAEHDLPGEQALAVVERADALLGLGAAFGCFAPSPAGVDAGGEAADDAETAGREIARKLERIAGPATRRVTAANDGQRRQVQRGRVADYI